MQWKMNASKKKKFKVISFLLSVVLTLLTSALAKPTLSFTLSPALPSIPSFSAYTQQLVERKQAEQMKTYSGVRVHNDSLVMIYFHDQTIAIVELGPKKLLWNCELIEVYNDNDGMKLLHQLSVLNRPLGIGFKDMIKLMEQCEIVDRQRKSTANLDGTELMNNNGNAGSVFSQNPFSLLSGIIPGTKWCGPGDIAKNYHDLGTDSNMDRCCRAHDLCPAKVRAYQTRYDLSNNSLYTKSHCVCDDMLFSCLKRTNTSGSQVLGTIYFNLVQVPCLDNTPNGKTFRRAREGF